MSQHPLTHFAIHIDEMDRARQFYAGVFNWGFVSYGPPDFLQIKTGPAEDDELIGALQSRKYSPVEEKLQGLECTFAVEDLDDTMARVISHGGKLLMPRTAIPQVGWIAKFLDTEGNLLCAMQYDRNAK